MAKKSRAQWAEWGRNPPKWLPEDTKARLKNSLRPMAQYEFVWWESYRPVAQHETRIYARDLGEAKDKFWDMAHERQWKVGGFVRKGRVEGSDFYEPDIPSNPPIEEEGSA